MTNYTCLLEKYITWKIKVFHNLTPLLYPRKPLLSIWCVIVQIFSLVATQVYNPLSMTLIAKKLQNLPKVL